MTIQQIAKIMRFADLIEEADAIFDHQFWLSLPKAVRDRIEAIPGMDYIDRNLASQLRDVAKSG